MLLTRPTTKPSIEDNKQTSRNFHYTSLIKLNNMWHLVQPFENSLCFPAIPKIPPKRGKKKNRENQNDRYQYSFHRRFPVAGKQSKE